MITFLASLAPLASYTYDLDQLDQPQVAVPMYVEFVEIVRMHDAPSPCACAAAFLLFATLTVLPLYVCSTRRPRAVAVEEVKAVVVAEPARKGDYAGAA